MNDDAPPLPPGFSLRRRWLFGMDVVGSHYPVPIARALPFTQESVRIFGKTHLVPRLTHWMGTHAYTYSGIRHAPSPVPAWIERIRIALSTEFGQDTNSVLANLYRDGSDTVGWHSDDEPELGTHPWIASLSIGDSREFKIRTRAQNPSRGWDVDLHNGDLLIMYGDSQRGFQHSLPRTARPVGPRVNLTFRTVCEGFT